SRLPSGIIAVGNEIQGGRSWTFVPLSESAPGLWAGTVHFGKPTDHGSRFSMVAIVIPSQEETYLLNEGTQEFNQGIDVGIAYARVHPKNTPSAPLSWSAPGFPAPPAYIAAHETVQRTASMSDC